MKHKLEVYEQKRRFDETPEPRGRATRRSVRPRDGEGSFVIQRHDARRLHYDFRLELDGTLKSWAIPKGPSLDPSVKRLAVHVEDHPIEYGTFEGRIPEGSYGAGTVAIWDHGVWRPEGGLRGAREGYAQGKLKFTLEGERLHGGWTLVRSPMHDGKQESWLLIKQRDDEAAAEDEFRVVEDEPGAPKKRARAANGAAKREGGTMAGRAVPQPDAGAKREKAAPSARSASSANAGRTGTRKTTASALEGAVRAPLPETLAPELATPADAPPHGDNWLYELKFDGYRVLARIDRGARGKNDVRIFTRTGNDWTAKFPRQVEALRALEVESAWLDGEAVVLDEAGVPDFQTLQNAFDAGRADAITFWLFDLPWLDGMDLREVPLEARREKLSALLAGKPQDALRFSEAFEGEPQALLEAACEANLEGLVAKRRDSRYTSTRSAAWLKLRCARRQEFVIGGYTEPQGRREGFGALLIGVYDEHGALQYAGKVGTGFDAMRLEAVGAELRSRECERPPFAAVPAGERRAPVHWVRPELVAEVRFKTWTSAGVVRQASFAGLRRDKSAKDVVREAQSPPVRKPASERAAHTAQSATKTARNTRRAPRGEAEVAGIRITHPERVIDAQSGLRKIDLVEYFEAVSPWLLPHVQQRPVALVRAPKGVGGELFFQKHASRLAVPHATQHAGLDPGHAPLLTLDSAAALVGAAQMDTIELHTWNALATDIEKPDRIVFDLDPDPSLAWERMLEAAQLTRELLDALGLRAWCKTSGGKGLHLVVPLARHAGWVEAKDFARAVASHMAATLPDRFSAKMGAQNRKGRIFVDYLRNNRGASTAAAYAPRARPGLGVSVPVAWDELHTLTGGDQWNVVNVRERLEALRTDPWREYGKARQRITAAMWKQLETK
ncbi:DNA ligase D [Paraburkholderia lycopersici]|uniref:DNA ligase (ATP) n=1 Tax=Paraburkholderia lycopersici TaxID=416944 RepID=A0A1G7BPW7_9BURK|nr:DNA ligase D [Paraburkholderia lycopersici]SDE29003.1 bifunctional non-homologous end joining protein LigD [Paraburkholderia lycopersici]